MTSIRRLAPAVLALGVASLAVASPATADPAKGFHVPLTCDNGISYDAVVMGNGLWSPAHDTASNTMLIPTAFGEFHGVLTDDEGNVLEEFTDPAVTRAANKPRRTSAHCTFVVEDTFEIPDIGVVHFTGEGEVWGFSTPAR